MKRRVPPVPAWQLPAFGANQSAAAAFDGSGCCEKSPLLFLNEISRPRFALVSTRIGSADFPLNKMRRA